MRSCWGLVMAVACSDPEPADDGPTTLMQPDPETADTGPFAPLPGLDARPANPSCVAFRRPDGAGSGAAFPTRLSETGCMDPDDPRRPLPGLVPYETSHQFWSDGSDKERWLAVPDGRRITIGDDGDWALPVGSVVVKQFSRSGSPIETRLYVHHDDGWGGYSYTWNAEGTDAIYDPTARVVQTPSGAWAVPSSEQCIECHTAAAGFTLGLTSAQLASELTYPSTGRTAPQLATLAAVGLVEPPPVEPLPLPGRDDPSASDEELARTYLHVNCASCHRPDSDDQGRASFDARRTTPLSDMGLCDVESGFANLGIADARLIAPGFPERSVLLARMQQRDFFGMPPAGTLLPDPVGVGAVEAWIASLPGCD